MDVNVTNLEPIDEKKTFLEVYPETSLLLFVHKR